MQLKIPKLALDDFDQALAIEPNFAMANYNRGEALNEMRRYDEALASYDRALTARPNYAEALRGGGNVLLKFKQYERALDLYNRALAINPELDFLLGHRLHAKMFLCDWRDFELECDWLLAALRAGRNTAAPFEMLAIPSMASDQLTCAKHFCAKNYTSSGERFWRGERYAHERIRIAYLSADFRQHPIAYLTAELFELHDRSKFETYAISYGVDDRSDIRARLTSAFDHFHDVQSKTDAEIAMLLHGLQVEIAVDLMGHTAESRLGILAHRPVPIQVSYLGSASTTGADFLDYIIADATTLPIDQKAFFTEQVVHLPDTYQANDSKRAIAKDAPTRSDTGLPDSGFVFCCFNNSYKITPKVFDVWMRLLLAVEGSVLWLLRDNEGAGLNLRKEAAVGGIDPNRIVFAEKLPLAVHLARHRLADLFLDTLPYNAHTTASDALWAGLPVLTCRGETFAGRVAASLLQAVGLPELITTNLADYEVLALKLAREPALLAEIKAKLARHRDTFPLFNAARFTRHIEAAYAMMWEIWQRGEAPKSFSVAPIER